MTHHDDRERPHPGEERVDRPREGDAPGRTGKQAAQDIGLGTGGLGTGDLGPGVAGGDVSGRPVEVDEADRRRGVVEERETSVVGNVGAGREAGLANSAGSSSQQAGKHGSGSTTTVPGGTAAPDPRGGSVGGTGALGAGGIAPSGTDLASSPVANTGVKGAGARGEEREEAEKAAHREEPRGKDQA